MAQSGRILVLIGLLLLASCSFGAGSEAVSPPSAGESTAGLSPTTSASRFGQSIPQVVIQSPLLIDGEDGRLYAAAQVNGESRVAALDTRSGRLLDAWDAAGQLALDATRDRLVLDGGVHGLTTLDPATGEIPPAISLPPQENPPTPQVDEKTGLIYAFRAATIYVIDPAIRGVIREAPLNVASTVCDTPAGDAPIYRTAINPAAGQLILTFITATCTPWATVMVVVLDAADLTEIGRFNLDINYQLAPFGDSLYGLAVSRLGPTLYWIWDADSEWIDQSDSFQGPPRGMAVDVERELVYEAIGETIRIVNPRDAAVVNRVTAPLLAEGSLSGHDPYSDMLYFVSATGRLYLWPAANLFDEQSAPIVAESPFPLAPVRAIALPPNWVAERTMAALVDNGDCPVDGGRLFLMTDPGAGWLESAVGSGYCEAIAEVVFSPDYIHDSLIFAAANQPATILRSVDAGRSWTAAETPFPEGATFSALLPSPNYASDQTLYAFTTAGLLYRSRDGGRAWHLLDQRLDRIALVGGAGLPPRLYGAYGGRILRADAGGERWADTGATPGGESLELFAAAPSAGETPILFAFTAGGWFSRSIDEGASWSPILGTSPAPARLAIAATMPEETRPIFLLHEETVEASYDGMASIWSDLAAGEAGRYRPTAIAVAPDFAAAPYLFVGTADGQIISVRVGAHP